MHGKTLNWLLCQCKVEHIDDLTSNLVKHHVVYNSWRTEDITWRTPIAIELFRVKNEEMYIEGFSSLELNERFNHICTESS